MALGCRGVADAVAGIPAVALSLDFGTEPLSMAKVDPHHLKWDTAAQCAALAARCSLSHPVISFGARVVQTALANPLPEGSWVNVNVPNLAKEKVRGIRLTKQGVSTYQEYFSEVKPKEGAPPPVRTAPRHSSGITLHTHKHTCTLLTVWAGGRRPEEGVQTARHLRRPRQDR